MEPRQTGKVEKIFVAAIQGICWLGVLAFWGYISYYLFEWLFVGAGVPVLLFGMFLGIIWLFGSLPDWISKRTGQARREAERSIRDFLFVVVGIALGCYWIPKQFDLKIAWYWKPFLGIAVASFGLITRRDR